MMQSQNATMMTMQHTQQQQQQVPSQQQQTIVTQQQQQQQFTNQQVDMPFFVLLFSHHDNTLVLFIPFCLFFYSLSVDIQQQMSQQQNFQQIINNNPLQPIVNQQAANPAAQICIRSGCTNPAVVSIDWEDEYCSNECCLSHCKNVFAHWIQNNQQNFTVAS